MVVALIGAVVLGLLRPRADVPDARFWLLAALVVLGELFPIRVPRSGTSDEVTISTPFAFAILLAYGIVPALIVYVAAYLLAGVLERVAPLKLGFNAAQYGLSLLTGAGVLALVHQMRWEQRSMAETLGAVLLGGIAIFVSNHLLAGVSGALLGRENVASYLRRDLLFQVWTAGFLLALTPIVLASAQVSLILVPLLFLPMLGIWIGGREAARAAHHALHDELTGLPNRRLFEQRLDRALSGAGRVALLIVDIEDFRAVNDTLGHEQGDRLLAAVAHRLDELSEGEMTVARLGGDEFAVLAPRAARPDDGAAIAEQVLAALGRPWELAGVAFDVRASIGVALHPEHGGQAAELLRHADVALYRAKASSTPYGLYTPAHDEGSRDRLTLAAQLRRGIERGELVVEYQPKLALSHDRPDAVEALVRWRHPQLGLVSPDGFIPLAEQTGLIKPLTLQILATAMEQCSAWAVAGTHLGLAVNVSNRSLLDRELIEMIRDALGRHDLQPEMLQLEITEGELVADLRRARAVLDELRGMGVTVAIDDFGTGFSSLAQLQRLPVDEIKIDKSFVLDMESNAHNATIVRSTIDLAGDLGLVVTAEGIESEDVLMRLAEMGCDYGQGYFLGRPAAAKDLDLARARARARGARLITGPARRGVSGRLAVVAGEDA
jgi:diguanylate cyclase (GGDEF)-like protein